MIGSPTLTPTQPQVAALQDLIGQLSETRDHPTRMVPEPLKPGQPAIGSPTFGPHVIAKSGGSKPYTSPLNMPPRYVKRTRKRQDKSKRKRPEPRMIIPQPLNWGPVPEYSSQGASYHSFRG